MDTEGNILLRDFGHKYVSSPYKAVWWPRDEHVIVVRERGLGKLVGLDTETGELLNVCDYSNLFHPHAVADSGRLAAKSNGNIIMNISCTSQTSVEEIDLTQPKQPAIVRSYGKDCKTIHGLCADAVDQTVICDQFSNAVKLYSATGNVRGTLLGRGKENYVPKPSTVSINNKYMCVVSLSIKAPEVPFDKMVYMYEVK